MKNHYAIPLGHYMVTIKPPLKHHKKYSLNHHQVTSSHKKKSPFFMTKKKISSSRMDRKVSAESSAPKTNWRSWRDWRFWGFWGPVEALKLGVKMGQRNSVGCYGCTGISWGCHESWSSWLVFQVTTRWHSNWICQFHGDHLGIPSIGDQGKL